MITIELEDFKLTAEVKKTGGSYFIYIPPTIVKMLNIKDGDIVEVPFLLFKPTGESTKKPPKPEIVEEPYEYPLDVNGLDSLKVVFKGETINLTRENVIRVLNQAKPEMESWRSLYIPWHHKKYNVGSILAKLLGEPVNSGQGATWLEKLGFKIVRK